MKHVLMMEELGDNLYMEEYKVGDKVILLVADSTDRHHGFNVGDMCTIIKVLVNSYIWGLDIDPPACDFPFTISNSTDETTVRSYQIRKATDLEVDVNSYNL